MNAVVSIITKLFDVILLPFYFLPPSIDLILLSVIAGIVFLKLFGITSNQSAIKNVRDKIKANILSAVIYRGDCSVSFGSIMRMIGYNFIYLRYAFTPLAVLLAVFALVYGQLGLRYGNQPLVIDEPVTVSIYAENGYDLHLFSIKTGSAIQIDTPALRVKQRNEINWVVTPVETGMHDVVITYGDSEVCNFPVFTGNVNVRKIPDGVYKNWTKRLLHPGARQLDRLNPVRSLAIFYPTSRKYFLGWQLHWLAIFLIVSVVSGFAGKRLVNVEI